MSKHYRILDNKIIDLRMYEMELRFTSIKFSHKYTVNAVFCKEYNTSDEACAEFEIISQILKTNNKPLFYEVGSKIIINLREVKSMNRYLDTKICFTFFCGEQSDWSYDKTFDTPEAAETELKRLKELLVNVK